MKIINIFNCSFAVNIYDEKVLSYLLDRFRGFLHYDQNIDFDAYIISEETIIDEQLENIKDEIIITDNTLQKIINIGSFATIIHKKKEKRIIVQKRNVSLKISQIIGVNLCDIILDVLYENNIFCMHCGVVSVLDDCNNGIAIIGHSGSGKTTLTLKFAENGAVLTNDDIAYFKFENQKIVVIKNTQYIGLDEANLNANFSYLKPYIVSNRNYDKLKVDLYAYNKQLYANKITINRFLFISKNHTLTQHINYISSFDAFRRIINISNQFNRGRYSSIFLNCILDICMSIKSYEASLSDSLSDAVSFLLDSPFLFNSK